jgi:hypothetical protein
LICPATSVFGEADNGKMPLQAYGRHLKAHGTPVTGVVTEMRFDTSSPTPKLLFKPIRPISEEEFNVVNEMRNSPVAEEAVKMTITPAKPKPAQALFEPTPKAAKAVKAEVEEVVEEPKKAVSKKSSGDAPKLADLVNGWDD